MSRFRSLCFTSYKDVVEYEQDKVNYIIFQREVCPKTKKEHWQGYCELKKQLSMKQVKKLFNDKALHIESRKGNQQQAIDYCKKEESRKEGEEIHEYGTPAKQGKRTDLKTFIGNLESKSLTDAIDLNPETYVKYHSGMDKLNNHYIKKKNTKKLNEEMKEVTLRPWQVIALNKLKKQDDRKITWVVDLSGNKGKSYLSRYLISKYNAFYSRNGKNADIVHAYNYEDYIIFDFPRSSEEFINYGIIEQFKDGILFSPKYNSHTKIKRGAKVICFSNFHPDLSKLSMDRWDIYDISNNYSEVVGNTNHHKSKPLSKKNILRFE